MPHVARDDPRRADSEFQRHLRWAIVWPLAAFFAAAGLLVALLLYVQDAHRWVDHTDVVIGRATLVERLIVDRESRLRAYVITGDRRFLDAYRGDDAKLPPAVDDLQKLVADNRAQVLRVASLRPPLMRWRAYAEQMLALSRDSANAPDVPFYLLDGEAVAEDIRSRLREFVSVEDALRVDRAARAEAATRFGLFVGGAFALALGPVLALATAREMRRSRQKYREALEVEERTAASLQASEEKLRLAKDAARMGSWDWDLRSGELVWSDRCKALFGIDPATPVTYEAFLASIHPDDRERVHRGVEEALKHAVRYDAEMRVPWPDGSVRWVASRGEAFVGPEGRAVRMTGMALDITAQKRAEEALREADRRKDEFLGMLSHELRNPLAPIRHAVYVLGRVDPASAEAARARAIVGRQVEHLARLVDDLLDVKRISTGKLRLHRTVMDLAREVRDTVEDTRPLFAERSLSLVLNMPSEPPWVMGDRTRLAQVVSNLLHNAAKFTDAGGHVWVTLERGDGEARIRVRDDGVGVPPEMLDHLFDAFVQSDKTLHRTAGGLGLGLSLVRGIAELHGGSVVARSEGLGKGTELVVRLPTTDAVLAPSPEVKPARPRATRRVLIVEDNADAAESLRDLVEVVGGHEVCVVGDGEAGVAAARERPFDVVLCDIGLPVMDGYEVARRVRAAGASRGARLVAVSGYASAEDVDRALRAGFDDHLAKPADVDQVLALVAAAPRSAGAPRDDAALAEDEADPVPPASSRP